MTAFLHLIKADSSDLAASVIASNLRETDARVTVVVLGSAPGPPLPAAATVRRLGDDLDYQQLVDLIFAHDRVVTW
jgi:hypothetical protein